MRKGRKKKSTLFLEMKPQNTIRTTRPINTEASKWYWIYSDGIKQYIAQLNRISITSYIRHGFTDMIGSLTAALSNPFALTWTDRTPKCIMLFLLAYGMGIGIYWSTGQMYRRGEEHGSAVGYDGKPLIRDIEMRLSKERTLTLIGPNGSEKSAYSKR